MEKHEKGIQKIPNTLRCDIHVTLWRHFNITMTSPVRPACGCSFLAFQRVGTGSVRYGQKQRKSRSGVQEILGTYQNYERLPIRPIFGTKVCWWNAPGCYAIIHCHFIFTILACCRVSLSNGSRRVWNLIYSRCVCYPGMEIAWFLWECTPLQGRLPRV